jgi:hypothetical protein
VSQDAHALGAEGFNSDPKRRMVGASQQRRISACRSSSAACIATTVTRQASASYARLLTSCL